MSLIPILLLLIPSCLCRDVVLERSMRLDLRQVESEFDTLQLDVSMAGKRRILANPQSQELDGRRGLQEICGEDHITWSQCYDLGLVPGDAEKYKASKAVGRIIVMNAYTCTGFLVSSNGLFLTDSSCILNQTEATQSLITFGAEVNCISDGSDDVIMGGGGYTVSGATEVFRNEDLDIVLLSLHTNPTFLEPFGYLEFSDETPQIGEEVYAVQYPGAKTSAISSECKISLKRTTTSTCPSGLAFDCDMDLGALGAPVLSSSTNKVLAIYQCTACPNQGTSANAIRLALQSFLKPECTRDDDCAMSLYNSMMESFSPCAKKSCFFGICMQEGNIPECSTICTSDKECKPLTSVGVCDHAIAGSQGFCDFTAMEPDDLGLCRCTRPCSDHPVFSERYQDPGDGSCDYAHMGKECAPICGDAFRSTIANPAICQGNGSWTPFSGCLSSPVSNCPLPAFTNRYLDPGNCDRMIGSVCLPICGVGFHGSTAEPIECTPQGTWTSFNGCTREELPVTCPEPPFSTRYRNPGTCGFLPGSQCFPLCGPGFGASPAIKILCGSDGVWTSMSGCDAFPPPDGLCGDITFDSRYMMPKSGCGNTLGIVCLPTCGEGFQATPAVAITCKDDGWTPFVGCNPGTPPIELDGEELQKSLDDSCVSQGNCDDGRECNVNYCEGSICVTLPRSGCHTCKDVGDCPSGGSCRIASCNNSPNDGLCNYNYKDCGDSDTCTVDYCKEDTCHHDIVSPLVPSGDSCLSYEPSHIFTLQFLVEDKWNEDSILQQLLDCIEKENRKTLQGAINVVKYSSLSNGKAEVTVTAYGKSSDQITRTGATLVELVDSGVCNENFKDSMEEYWSWTSCVADYPDATGVYSAYCMDDASLIKGKVAADSVNSGGKSDGMKIFIVFLVFSILGALYYAVKRYDEDPNFLRKMFHKPQSHRGHMRTSSMPYQDEETGTFNANHQQTWIQASVSSLRNSIGPSITSLKDSMGNSISSLQDSVGNSVNSFADLVTHSARTLLRSTTTNSNEFDDVATEIADPEERESLTPSKNHTEAKKSHDSQHVDRQTNIKMSGERREKIPSAETFLTRGLDNSTFLGMMMEDFDEDEIDPLNGWVNRKENAGPPEIVQIQLPVGEIPGGPTKITLSCDDSDSLSDFLMKACQKIDSMRHCGNFAMGEKTSAVSRNKEYTLVDVLGSAFHNESVVGNLHAQLRSFRKEEDVMVEARLHRRPMNSTQEESPLKESQIEEQNEEHEESPLNESQIKASKNAETPTFDSKHQKKYSVSRSTMTKTPSPRQFQGSPSTSREIRTSPEVLAAIHAASQAVDAAIQVAEETSAVSQACDKLEVHSWKRKYCKNCFQLVADHAQAKNTEWQY